MLTIMPEKDKHVFEPILEKCRTKGKEALAVLTAKDEEKNVGYVAVGISERTLWILDFRIIGVEDYQGIPRETRQLADSMIKAAASYAMNRNVFRMECGVKPIYPLLEDFGFQKFHENLCIDLAHLIKRCGNC